MILTAFLLNSCIEIHDTFQSKKLVSSKGEKFYINTLNWGMTDDNQYTVISKDFNRLKERGDTIGGISGLTPFVYKFSNDTLTLVFPKGTKIKINKEFDTIELNYLSVENGGYMELLSKAIQGEGGYHLVPE
jgi:hypothetical protein